MPDDAANFEAKDLSVGMTYVFHREITEDEIQAFALNSGDMNPLHVDSEYARTTKYGRRIVHGAFQVSLASAVLGMRLPGRKALLTSISSRFPKPLFYPCKIKVSGKLISWNPYTKSGSLKVVVQDAGSLNITSEIVLGFTLHEKNENSGQGPLKEKNANMTKSQEHVLETVMLTGASGGIGFTIAREIAKKYCVIAVVNTTKLDAGLSRLPNVEQIQVNLKDPDIYSQLDSILGNRPIYGIIHAAWPGAPRGGLLNCPNDVLENQLFFGTLLLPRLGKLLFDRVNSKGGRFIAIGSTFGSLAPNISLSAYSLGKGSLEHTVKLLAPELARKNITINTISPSFVAVGINRHVNERHLKMEAAKVPMGRLCWPEDIAGAIMYLLSPEAAYISGQNLALTGARIS